MNNEELKRKAEEWAASVHGNGLAHQYTPNYIAAFLAGHQIALEGASEGFDGWFLARFPGAIISDGFLFKEAWQARGLLVMKREGELVARIEKLREALVALSRRDEGLPESAENTLARLALAADKGE